MLSHVRSEPTMHVIRSSEQFHAQRLSAQWRCHETIPDAASRPEFGCLCRIGAIENADPQHASKCIASTIVNYHIVTQDMMPD